jgi:TRAP-type mannitol/chloroaromatic compound transport system permease small subunit
VAGIAEPQLEDQPAPPAEHRSWPYLAFERVLMALNNIGSVWIFALMFLICADVVMRAFFNAPIDGVADIAAFSIIGIVFLQLGATVHTNRMTKGDVLLEIISKRSARAGALVEALFLFVGAVMFALIIRAAWPLLTRAIQRDEFFGVQGVFTFPTWPVRVIIIVGSIAVVLVYLVKVWEQLRRALGDAR